MTESELSCRFGMNPRHVVLLFALLVTTGSAAPSPTPALEDGDLIFHESRSAQSAAIRAATGSPWTHVGLVFIEGGRPVVWEAVGPVKGTPLDRFIARGRESRYVVKRVAGGLSREDAKRLREAVMSFAGRPYDVQFRWDDARLYCSELVWKAYMHGPRRRLVEPTRLGDANLGAAPVRALVAKRYKQPVPLDEPVVSPALLFDAPGLVTVAQR